MKRPIGWHRECAGNARASLEKRERELAGLMAAIERYRTQVDFYDAQIAEAEKRGMAEFDAERLLVKRNNAK